MRIIFYSFGLLGILITLTAYAPHQGTPVVNFSSINEIAELYEDGQYEVVKAKLINQGFTVTNAEPDYTLHERTHAGTFTMTYEADSPSATYRLRGWKDRSVWRFSTEKNAYSREVNIDFELPDHRAQEAYNDFVRLWTQFKIASDHLACNTGQTCTRFWGAVGGAPIGYQDYARAQYGFEESQIKEQGEQAVSVYYLKGSITYRRVKNDSKPSKPALSRKASVNKHK